jgi:hypothetical protein
MPYISTEALVGAALLVIVALGYQYIPVTSADGSSSTNSKSSKKKNKKKSRTTGDVAISSAPLERTEPPKSTSKAIGKESRDEPVTALSPSSIAEPAKATKPKTLAQKIAPQPRKTKVDE